MNLSAGYLRRLPAPRISANVRASHRYQHEPDCPLRQQEPVREDSGGPRSGQVDWRVRREHVSSAVVTDYVEVAFGVQRLA